MFLELTDPAVSRSRSRPTNRARDQADEQRARPEDPSRAGQLLQPTQGNLSAAGGVGQSSSPIRANISNGEGAANVPHAHNSVALVPNPKTSKTSRSAQPSHDTTIWTLGSGSCQATIYIQTVMKNVRLYIFDTCPADII